jgi:hypothetical protein
MCRNSPRYSTALEPPVAHRELLDRAREPVASGCGARRRLYTPPVILDSQCRAAVAGDFANAAGWQFQLDRDPLVVLKEGHDQVGMLKVVVAEGEAAAVHG